MTDEQPRQRLRHQATLVDETAPVRRAAAGFEGRLQEWADAAHRPVVRDVRASVAIVQSRAHDRQLWQVLGVESLMASAEREARRVFGSPPSPQSTVTPFTVTDECIRGTLRAGAHQRVQASGLEWVPRAEITACFVFRAAATFSRPGHLIIAWDGGCISKPLEQWTRVELEDLVFARLEKASQEMPPAVDFPYQQTHQFVDVGYDLDAQGVAND